MDVQGFSEFYFIQIGNGKISVFAVESFGGNFFLGFPAPERVVTDTEVFGSFSDGQVLVRHLDELFTQLSGRVLTQAIYIVIYAISLENFIRC